MELTRHHGLGNTFLIGLVENLPRNSSEMAKKWCDSSTGIGADGLIFGTPLSPGSEGVAKFTLFNRDGSRAEVSGNGLRCFAQALSMSWELGTSSFLVETDVGARRLILSEEVFEKEMLVTVEMGIPVIENEVTAEELGLKKSQYLRAIKVDAGNPHLVLEVEDLDAVDLKSFAVKQDRRLAPRGCNVHFMLVKDRSSITLKHWERGVGITEACGSGACASVFAARCWELVDKRVEVQMPGGVAVITLTDTLLLSGPAVFIDTHKVENE